MRNSVTHRYAVSISATAALLSGCGGSQPSIDAPGMMPQPEASVKTAHINRSASWMLPQAKSDDLLYVSYPQGPSVYVYSYPKVQEVGEIKGFTSGFDPQGLCSDRSGNIFVTAVGPGGYASAIYKYAHGEATPVVTLSDPAWIGGCAIDPSTGDLAVTNISTNGAVGNGDVLIYPSASGTPTVYDDSSVRSFLFCAYDTHGDLFSTTGDAGGGQSLLELHQGTANFTSILIDKSFPMLSVQWVNGGLAIDEATASKHGPATVYQLQVSGSSATVIGSTVLRSRRNLNYRGDAQYWVQGNTIIAPYAHGGAALWRYPEGGLPKKATQSGYAAFGVAVSLAKN